LPGLEASARRAAWAWRGAAIVGIAMLLAARGAAAPLPNGERPLQYAVVDQELREVLLGIGAELGLRVEVSQAVRGRVRGRLPPASAEEMLRRLADLYAFDWYHDGEVLWVSARSEAVSKLVALPGPEAQLLRQALAELGIADPRWPVRVSARAGLVMVSGPPRYAALVEQAAAALARRQQAPLAVRVFRGSAASPL